MHQYDTNALKPDYFQLSLLMAFLTNGGWVVV